MIKDMLVGHIDAEDLGWAPLSPHNVALKGRVKIYVETGALSNGMKVHVILSWFGNGYSIYIVASAWTTDADCTKLSQ